MSKIFKKIGSALKSVAKFVKKHWKTIAIVALSVFTMGIATVGFSGFMGAATAGGTQAMTFGSFMSAVGSTMWAGVTAAGGTLGIGGGAQGTAAAYGGVTGQGLFGGHLAAAMGSESAKAGIAAQTGRGAGVVLTPAAGTVTGNLAPAATAPTPGAPGVLNPGPNPALANTVKPPLPAPAPAAGGGLLNNDLSKAALITVAGNAAAGYGAAKAAEPDDPLALWGVDLTGGGANAAPLSFSPQPAPLLFPTSYPTYAGAIPQQGQQVAAPIPPGLMNGGLT